MMTDGISGSYCLTLIASTTTACRWISSFSTAGAATIWVPPYGEAGCFGSNRGDYSGITIDVIATQNPSDIQTFAEWPFSAFSPPLAAHEWAWMARVSGFINNPPFIDLGILDYTAIARITGCPTPGTDLGAMGGYGVQGSSFPTSITTWPCGHLTVGELQCFDPCVHGECEGPLITTSSCKIQMGCGVGTPKPMEMAITEPKPVIETNPSVWGPALWRDLHGRPKTFVPSDSSRESEINWLNSFAEQLPCDECKEHWKEIVSKTPPDLASQQSYFWWTFDRHNEVNARLGKPVITRDMLSSHYDWIDRPFDPTTPANEIDIKDKTWERRRVFRWPNVQEAYRNDLHEVIKHIPEYPGGNGKGIVTIAGGRYWAAGIITILVCRHNGINLPVEMWHLPGEITDGMRKYSEAMGIVLREADCINGWALKLHALKNSSFEEILYLDSDSYPTKALDDFWECEGYKDTGFVMFPDRPSPLRPLGIEPGDRLKPRVFEAFGLPFINERSKELGQAFINRKKQWRTLWLSDYMGQHSNYWFYHVYGDKDLPWLAARLLNQPYYVMPTVWDHEGPALVHYDWNDRVRFVHRAFGKFDLYNSGFTTTNQKQDRADQLPHEPLVWDYFEKLKVDMASDIIANSEQVKNAGNRPVPKANQRLIFKASDGPKLNGKCGSCSKKAAVDPVIIRAGAD